MKIGRMPLSGSEALVASGKARIEINGLLKKFLRERVVISVGFSEMPQPTLVGSPGVEAAGRLAHRALLLGLGDGRSDRGGDRLRDLVLHREDVDEVTVVALGPDVLPGFGLDQLSGDADAVAGFPQAAFEHITHTELAPDLLHIDRPTFVGETRSCAR